MMDPLERASVLLTLMRELRAVLERENLLLRNMGLEELRSLQEDKHALADAYEVEVRRLRQSPDFVASLDPEVRATLEEAMRALQETMRRNLNALGAARLVAERVARHIAEAASTAALERGQGSAKVVPLAVDRQL